MALRLHPLALRGPGARPPRRGGHRCGRRRNGLKPLNPLPSGERVARRAGEGDVRFGMFGKSATPSP
ncbi:hypothetical protein CHT98_01640 [Azospirillum brasilense]|uniref:Uncharacterized protein n=1 Tax=Azospirillum brasilense TaxID=192 RepID=A0A235HL63_AZOBR|nr:hypothetical protein CHT98_01640 [Azospirillum brasilense]